MSALTTRQRHCLVALLEIEEENAERRREHNLHFLPPAPIFAGEVARRIGFGSGPRQHGNGAKDGRSFSGTGALGKWTAGALMGLERRGLVRRYYRRHHAGQREPDRVQTNELTQEGWKVAWALRDAGLRPQEVRYTREAYGGRHDPVEAR